MTQEILLKPKYDVVFHALFGENNKELAELFISDLLGQEAKIQNILDRHLSIKSTDQKFGVMDYRAILTDNTYCNVEIQLQEQDFEIERFLYYLADTYSRQLSIGEEYDEINKTISIVILDHEIDKLKVFNRLDVKWQMRDNITGVNLLTDKFELCIIELPKARRLHGDLLDNKVCNWMMFLDDPNSQEVQKIMEKDENVKEAYNKLKYLSKDEDMRRIAELKEKARRDEYARKHFIKRKEQEITVKEQEIMLKEQEITVKEQEIMLKEQEVMVKEQELQTMQEKIQEREQELQTMQEELQEKEQKIREYHEKAKEKNYIVEKLLQKNMSIKDISEITELTVEEVEKIKNDV